MMKKLLVCGLMALAAMSVQAQNVQLHYDFGRNLYPDEEAGRQKVTMTLEKFKELGSQSPFAAHIEYDGGLNRFGSFQQAALIGPAWNGHSADFSKTYSLQLMYKRYFKSYEYTHGYNSLQLTGVWGLTFARKACTFSGFIDFWRGEKANGHGQLVVLTEPQLWYNLNTLKGMEDVNLSIGTEWEVSSNFIYITYNDKSFFVNPTLAVKWTF